MEQFELSEGMARIANDLLTWVGFGTIAGLAAKAIMPGRDPGGAVATMLMGIGGSVIGCGVLVFFWDGHRVTPISPAGFVVATGGAFLLLLSYRVLGGFLFEEGETLHRRHNYRRRRSRRQRVAEYDD